MLNKQLFTNFRVRIALSSVLLLLILVVIIFFALSGGKRKSYADSEQTIEELLDDNAPRPSTMELGKLYDYVSSDGCQVSCFVYETTFYSDLLGFVDYKGYAELISSTDKEKLRGEHYDDDLIYEKKYIDKNGEEKVFYYKLNIISIRIDKPVVHEERIKLSKSRYKELLGERFDAECEFDIKKTWEHENQHYRDLTKKEYEANALTSYGYITQMLDKGALRLTEEEKILANQYKKSLIENTYKRDKIMEARAVAAELLYVYNTLPNDDKVESILSEHLGRMKVYIEHPNDSNYPLKITYYDAYNEYFSENKLQEKTFIERYNIGMKKSDADFVACGQERMKIVAELLALNHKYRFYCANSQQEDVCKTSTKDNMVDWGQLTYPAQLNAICDVLEQIDDKTVDVDVIKNKLTNLLGIRVQTMNAPPDVKKYYEAHARHRYCGVIAALAKRNWGAFCALKFQINSAYTGGGAIGYHNGKLPVTAFIANACDHCILNELIKKYDASDPFRLYNSDYQISVLKKKYPSECADIAEKFFNANAEKMKAVLADTQAAYEAWEKKMQSK